MPNKEEILRQQHEEEARQKADTEVVTARLIVCGYDPANPVEAFRNDVAAFRKEQAEQKIVIEALGNSRKQFDAEVAATRKELEQAQADAKATIEKADAYYKEKVAEADKYHAAKLVECTVLEQEANERLVGIHRQYHDFNTKFIDSARSIAKVSAQKLSYHQHKIMADKWGRFNDSVNQFIRSLVAQEEE